MGKFVDDLVKEESSRLPLQMTELKSARRNSLMVEIISASKSFAGSELDKPNSFRRFFLYFRGDAVCSPDSNFQLYWNLFVFFVLSYNLFMVPFRLAFENSDSFNFVLIVDYFGDFVWLLDSRVSQSERKCEKRSKWQEGLSSGLLVVFSLLAPVVGW